MYLCHWRSSSAKTQVILASAFVCILSFFISKHILVAEYFRRNIKGMLKNYRTLIFKKKSCTQSTTIQTNLVLNKGIYAYIKNFLNSNFLNYWTFSNCTGNAKSFKKSYVKKKRKRKETISNRIIFLCLFRWVYFFMYVSCDHLVHKWITCLIWWQSVMSLWHK